MVSSAKSVFSSEDHFPFSELRVIPYQFFPGALNMALDHHLALMCAENRQPVLRFYGWQPHTLSLGYHQSINKVDQKALQADGLHLVRRPTGGSAILHAHELTYSFILPLSDLNHREMYSFFHRRLAETLNRLGFPVSPVNTQAERLSIDNQPTSFACFNRSARYEIQFQGRKVVGSAQKIFRDSVLQHGSIMLDDTHLDIIRYMRIDDGEKQKVLNHLKSHSVSLAGIAAVHTDPLQLADALVQAFTDTGIPKVYYQYPQQNELHHALQLSDSTYSIC